MLSDEMPGQSVLIVPDTLLHGAIGSSFLDRAKFRVRAVGAGKEALQVAAVWRPRVIVLGAALGDIDLATFVRSARATDKDVKLILLADGAAPPPTGEDAPDLVMAAPVRAQQLIAQLATLLGVPIRAAPRVSLRILARMEGAFAAPTEEQAVPPAPAVVNLLDLSESGALIETPEAMRLGARGHLSFFLPGSPQRFVAEVFVRVLHDEAQLHYGVSFAPLADEDVKRLRAFIHTRIKPNERDGGGA